MTYSSGPRVPASTLRYAAEVLVIQSSGYAGVISTHDRF